MGYVDRPSSMTDMVWVGIFVVVGGLIGAMTLDIEGVPITLSTSGGALIAGIVLGWLRGVRPTFGQVPAPSLWFMNSVGLNVFIAVVGISAGPTFIEGLQKAGVALFLWGVFATAVPMVLAPLIGKFIFKFAPAINLGVCGGARTSTASVAMVGDVAKSDVPLLGYTVPYAVSNTLARVSDIRTPVLTMHGEADVRAPYRQFVLAVEILREEGKTFEAHSYPGEPHGFRDPMNRVDMYRRLEAWFARWLKGSGVTD